MLAFLERPGLRGFLGGSDHEEGLDSGTDMAVKAGVIEGQRASGRPLHDYPPDS